MALKYVVFREIMDQVTGIRGQGGQIASLSGHQNKAGDGKRKDWQRCHYHYT